MKPMLLTDVPDIPSGDDWLYEAKYDGYRCILVWEKGKNIPELKSRNGNVLNEKFPEIIRFCKSIYAEIEPYLPLIFDGEIVYLINHFQSKFSFVQKRGKMTNQKNIESNAKTFPCHYIVFDLLKLKGKDKGNSRLTTRKQLLSDLFERLNLLGTVQYNDSRRLQAIDVFEDPHLLWQKVTSHNGEGIIAKKRNSKWLENTRTKSWLKIKNWKHVNVILTKFDQSNGFFNGAIYQEDMLMEVVSFKHGLSEEESKTLITFFKSKGTVKEKSIFEIPPSICVTVACIDFDGSKLREPRFHSFQHHLDVTECNWQQMQRQLNPIPESVIVTHPDKPVFPASHITKDDYLYYLQTVAPMMMPFLQDRLLTVIRYPHGVPGESFYQKNYIENLPEFITTQLVDDTHFILCNNLESLLWLGNQLALEFHIPFQPVSSEQPTEIVFDLDPPSVHEFGLAVDAAIKFKTIMDYFKLTSFIKTSGGKGMQIYIPLPLHTFSYEDTGVFTEFICRFLVQQFPDSFTIERMKKNRGKRLYLDYVQHREGKTIVAPYSPRGNNKGLIATPLLWEEVNEGLTPDLFTIPNIIKRLERMGDPFKNFREVGERQPFRAALDQITGKQV
ncbi:bifunctional non-homologous end joining protein LigD [Solibacillus kalamii]|uniref:DNA ligase (ATP) n=1 Tax=Solibacillus kalamii TaxID=1748298 RepID=A0ABX3ZHT1_9BACL|nr:DNA ligase D [Solibacillus kalamii]MBM7663694.1 bifunctional non-homologous end joining protein LigD [Solibacillus kalamii]OUZ39052.1 DNA ligase D [Solibacillus kalamii]